MNFFSVHRAAERYARCRPYFHPLVTERIWKQLGLERPLDNALDVGCGTGQSTTALRTLAHSVVGVDISAAMLAEAPNEPGIRYVEAPAEAIPEADESFDLITTSLAFHWFDQEKFLGEVQRLLKPGGWLVIYNNGFSGQMKENPAFEGWSNEVYLTRYPSPPRNSQPLTAESAQKFRLDFAHREHYQNDISFTAEELAAYLTTQSNVIAAVEQGSETVEEVYGWLLDQVQPFFVVSPATFLFGGYIWYLRSSIAGG
jgi:ubiquinone/menaquinone biosynthesis C-methylase UbiE